MRVIWTGLYNIICYEIISGFLSILLQCFIRTTCASFSLFDGYRPNKYCRHKVSKTSLFRVVPLVYFLILVFNSRNFSFSVNGALTDSENLERFILLEFYKRFTASEESDGLSGLLTSSFEWNNSTGWKQHFLANETDKSTGALIPHCQWFGVQCSMLNTNDAASFNTVVGIDLSNNNLIGVSIPDVIYTLPNLKFLNLHGNVILKAGFPTVFPESPQAKRLHAPLEFVDFSDCTMTDISGISNFHSSLESLHLSRNDKLGSVSSFYNRTVENADVHFPHEILRLTNLVTLSLSMNSIRGTLPSEIGQLTRLSNLDLNTNQLTGTIPTTLKSLSNLSFLNLGNNLLSGSVSDDMIPCDELRILNIQGRSEDSELPPSMGYISGSLPSLSNCTVLHTLLLGHNRFQGSIPDDFLYNSIVGQDAYDSTGDLEGSMTISLVNNELSGTIPSSLSRFDSLSILLMGNIGMTGPVPDIFCRKNNWMHGLVAKFGCDAILCGELTYNDLGRQVSDSNPCVPCLTLPSERVGAVSCPNNATLNSTSTVQLSPISTTDGVESVSSSSGKKVLSELQILAEFYVQLDGAERWLNKDGWEDLDTFFRAGWTTDQIDGSSESYNLLKNIVVCEFFGVICNAQGQVRIMALQNNGLIGIIPGTLFQLPELYSIDFSYNRVSFASDDTQSLNGDSSMIGFAVLQNAPKLRRVRLSQTETNTLSGIGFAPPLTELHLDGCDFESSIPLELFQLTSLNTLHLEASYLTGTIPTQIGKLTNLRRLNLNENRLAGSIPKEIQELTGLEYLDLSDNPLSGNLPEELGNLSRLLSLRINSGSGGLGGPLPSFNKLTRIEDLELAFNKFNGTIPSDFLSGRESRSQLKIRLTSNDLQGGIPVTLANFSDVIIELEDNKITELPKELCSIPTWMDGEVGRMGNSCDAILCPKGYFSPYGRALPRDGVNCSKCDGNLYFGETVCETSGLQSNIEVEILDSLFTATGGRYWNASYINWTKTGVPICFREGVTCGWKPPGMNSGVTELRLNKFGLRGQIPTEIYQLPKLRMLSVASNPVDLSFNGIENAALLEVVNVAYTEVKSLAGIENAGKLFYDLHVAGAGLRSSFPTEILRLTNLRKLFLEDNRILGRIPPEIGNLTNIGKLGLNLNDLTGPIPSEIALLKNLDVLDLSGNKLSGTIPTEFGNLSKLVSLNLAAQDSVNKLGGPMYSFDLNPLLTSLNVSMNSFVGNVPTNLLEGINKTSHAKIDLSYNKFTGPFPESFANFTYLNIYLTGNMIDYMSPDICNNVNWMDGIVGVVSEDQRCNAILCKPGTMSPYGRQIHRGESCIPCTNDEEAPYFGSVDCVNRAFTKEREVLVEFSQQMTIDSWISSDNWLSDLNICAWYGVECNINDRVIALRMDNNGLVQSTNDTDVFELLSGLELLQTLVLDDSVVNVDFFKIRNESMIEVISLNKVGLTSLEGISHAQKLRRIIASDNNLTGTFPEELLTMTNLIEIFLSGNSFNGPIPSRLGSLSNLEHFLVQFNQLTGTLPPEIGQLTMLKELGLAENSISGKIPIEISNLRSLERISLRGQRGSNKINGHLPDFALAGQLWFVDLSDNSITGTIPSSFLSGSKVVDRVIEVILSDNKLEGTIPTSLSIFSRLDIHLSNNMIAEIPLGLCSNKNWMKGMVGRLGSSGCDAILCPVGYYSEFGRQVTNDVPCQRCDIKNQALYMGSTSCSLMSERDFLALLYNNTSGNTWKNSSNWLQDTPICSWYGVKCQGDSNDDMNITGIDLSSNGLDGTVPPELWQLPYANEFILKDNPDLYLSFSKVTMFSYSIAALDISGTRIENVTGLSHCKNLRNLKLSGLTGTLPNEILSIIGLQLLDLSKNYFVGTLPSSIGQLSELKQFLATGNDFHGPIPKEFSKLSNLEKLVLDENLVGETLPGTELSELRHLSQFSISRRVKSGPKLYGSLPSFDKAPELNYLLLDGNDLTGSIPEEFLAASNTIQLVDLRGNSLTGTVPLPLKGMLQSQVLVPESLVPDRTPVKSPLNDEREILKSIYTACGGKYWIRNDFWNTNTDYCNWYGIGCNNGHTVLINLQNNNLTGTFPPRVFSLSKLQVLWLSSNPLTTTFDNIHAATSLRELKLYNTSLKDIKGLSDAKDITVLDIGSNPLKDKKFPIETLNLFNLRMLSITENGLTGTLPDSLSNLRYLRFLDLQKNAFNGSLPSWSDNVVLTHVLLNNNLISGQIPKNFLNHVPSATSIKVELQNNQLTGSLPVELSRFERLNIELYDNRIDTVPSEICSNVKWNNGQVDIFGCDALMCPPGTSNPIGRQTTELLKCNKCRAGGDFFGQSQCGIFSSSSLKPFKMAWNIGLISGLSLWLLLA